jgi:hypothetical protein
MFIREENMRQGLEGICVRCTSTKKIAFRQEWHNDFLYKIGDCPGCGYEHHILVKKA